MAAAILASEDTEYHECPGFNPKMVRREAFSALRTCTDKSFYVQLQTHMGHLGT